jgi:hypothetical protein
MATLRGTQGRPGGVPWGWIIGLVVVGVATMAILWWLRAGAPPAGTTGQEGVEMRGTPNQQQPGAQPPVMTPAPAEQPPVIDPGQPQPGAQPGGPGTVPQGTPAPPR